MADLLQFPEFGIRPSYLPSWPDCPRRTAARLWRDVIETAGYELRQPGASVGAHVGTGVHEGANYTLSTKLESGELGAESEATDRAVEAFTTRLEDEGVTWDQATPNKSTGQKQVERMTKKYRSTLAPQVQPVLVEQRLEADLGDGWYISGQADLLAMETPYGSPEYLRLRDLKTGTTMRANGLQYIAYSMLLRAHEYAVKDAVEDFLRRVPLKQPQPEPETRTLPAGPMEHEAMEIIGEMTSSLGEFIRRVSEGDKPPESAFRANPQSVLCGSKWCPAHSTSFCKLHKPE
jgi:hypothetical protein